MSTRRLRRWVDLRPRPATVAGMRAFVLALLLALARPLAAQTPGFIASDLAVIGQPYTLRLPGGAACRVDWGDGGGADEVPANTQLATHTYRQVGVAEVKVSRRAGESWLPIPVDLDAAIRSCRPVLFERAPLDTRPLTPPPGTPADAFSVEAWLRFGPAGGDRRIWASAGDGKGGVLIGVRRPGVIWLELRGVGRVESSETDLADGQWHHLALTYDRGALFPANDRVRIYVDGRPIPVGRPTYDPTKPRRDNAGSFGAADPGPAQLGPAQLGGPGVEIAWVAAYTRELFPQVVAEHARVAAGATVLPVTIAYPGAAEAAVDLPRIERTIDLKLDPAQSADNGPALRKAIASAAPGTRLRLVGPDGRAGGRYVVRSLVEGNKWAGLVADAKRDFEFDGNGATLVFTGKTARFLWLGHGERVAIRNVSFDLDPDYARVGMYARLVAVDPETREVRARLVSGRDGSPVALPARASFWRWRPHDPKTLRIAERGGPHFDSGSYASKPTADGPDVGAFRFTLKQPADHKLWRELRAALAGNNFFLINNADFGANAISLTGGSHVTFERVNVYATLGMVFLSDDVDHLRVAECQIGLPPGLTAADRPLAAGADGYHFHQTRGHIVFERNEIALTDDDPVSIKDSVWLNARKVGDRSLSLGKGLAVGREVELLNPDYSATGYRANVVGVEKSAANGGKLDAVTVTLDRDLPADVKPKSIVMDRTQNTAHWVLRDNDFHDYYGRVMLYSDHGTVTGNRVRDSLYHLGNSTAYFEVAGACRNVLTHGNYFENTTADCQHWGDAPGPVSFHELTFSANAFVGQPLKLHNLADGLVVRNVFEGEGARAEIKSSRGVIVRQNPGAEGRVKVEKSEGVEVTE